MTADIFLNVVDDFGFLFRFVESLWKHEDGCNKVDSGDDGAEDKEPSPSLGLNQVTRDDRSNLRSTGEESSIGGHGAGIVSLVEEICLVLVNVPRLLR